MRNNRHENQETSIPPADNVGRPEKAHSRNAGVHGVEGSDPAIVPMKSPHNGPKGTAEGMEGRAGTKENAVQTCREPTQSGKPVSQGLRRVRQVAHERRKERFTALVPIKQLLSVPCRASVDELNFYRPRRPA